MSSDDRRSVVEERPLVADPDALARLEAENGVRQFELALDIVRTYVRDAERPFRLRPSLFLMLQDAALRGIDRFAGTFRNSGVTIMKSRHIPPDHIFIADEVGELCEYVNDHWSHRSALHLAAYVLWKLNWIHPFSDGNGRTSRTASYIVMSIKLDGLLPGSPTIPDQIATNKEPYYEALERADARWAESREVDVSALETMLEQMLARQLSSAIREAAEGHSE